MHALEPLLNTVAGLQPATLSKETAIQMFLKEICKNFKTVFKCISGRLLWKNTGFH